MEVPQGPHTAIMMTRIIPGDGPFKILNIGKLDANNANTISVLQPAIDGTKANIQKYGDRGNSYEGFLSTDDANKLLQSLPFTNTTQYTPGAKSQSVIVDSGNDIYYHIILFS